MLGRLRHQFGLLQMRVVLAQFALEDLPIGVARQVGDVHDA